MTRPERPRAEPLRETVARLAAPCDADGAFPRSALAAVVAAGWTAPARCGRAAGMARLLELLRELGRGDASVARLVEGHANALELIDRLAPEPLRGTALSLAAGGALYGVWGADPPEGRLVAERDAEGWTLSGAKAFCSGAGDLDAALVLADVAEGEGGRILAFVPRDAGLAVDRDAWRPLGMRASASHAVRFEAVRVGPGAVVCDGAAYLADPWFTGGAMRFAAAHAGAARGLADAARAALTARGRAGAPHQAARLGDIAAELAGLDGLLRTAAEAWEAGTRPGAPVRAARRAAAMGTLSRVAAERALMRVATVAQRAVGLGGLIAPHPLERRLRDALTYVRQPAPDAAREAAGAAFAEGVLDPEPPELAGWREAEAR